MPEAITYETTPAGTVVVIRCPECKTRITRTLVHKLTLAMWEHHLWALHNHFRAVGVVCQSTYFDQSTY